MGDYQQWANRHLKAIRSSNNREYQEKIYKKYCTCLFKIENLNIEEKFKIIEGMQYSEIKKYYPLEFPSKNTPSLDQILNQATPVLSLVENESEPKSILEEIESDFLLYKNGRSSIEPSIEYQKKVNELSLLLNLTGEYQLKEKFLPTYFMGNIDDPNEKIIIYSLNPGFSYETNPAEEVIKKKSLGDFLNFCKNGFTRLDELNTNSPYYNRLSIFLIAFDAILSNKNQHKKIDTFWTFLQKNVINIDLIPYHSNKINLNLKTKSKSKLEFLKKRYKINIQFCQTIPNKLIIFNGKPFYDLFNEYEITPAFCPDQVIKLNDKVNMYYWMDEGQRCILFDYFLTQIANGISNDFLEKKLPKMIKNIEIFKWDSEIAS